MKLTKNRLIIAGMLLILDCIFFLGVNPSKANSWLLFVAFALLAANLLGVWVVALNASRGLIGVPKGRLRKPAVLATVVCLLLLALESIGQLTLRDVVAVAALAAIIWFYASYSRGKLT